jgi:hypothetical protein
LNIGVDRQRSDCAGHTVTLSRTLIAGWREKIMQTKIITFEKKTFFVLFVGGVLETKKFWIIMASALAKNKGRKRFFEVFFYFLLFC